VKPDTSEILVFDTVSQETKQITANSVEDTAPSWLPDGEHIIFMRNDGHHTMRITDINGHEESEVYSCPATCDAPRWSPHAEQIIFTMNLDGRRSLFLLDLQELQPQQLTVGLDVVQPRWSPDGTQVAFSGADDDKVCHAFCESRHVYILDLATQKRIQLDTMEYSDSNFPSWSPDGKTILFTAFRTDEEGWLYLAQSDGSGIQSIAVIREMTWPVQIDWSPVGKSVVFRPILGVHKDHFVGQFQLP
jgi:Tol biopolymer transport system component